jgi:hypothetical protein
MLVAELLHVGEPAVVVDRHVDVGPPQPVARPFCERSNRHPELLPIPAELLGVQMRRVNG